MKKSWRNNLFLGVVLLSVFAACNRRQDQANAVEYTCPMHPQIVQPSPGTCPICGMDLVSRSAKETALAITKDLSYSLKPTNVSVLSSIRTITPVRKIMNVQTHVRGVVTHNTEKLGVIASKVNGRIERLFIRTDFQPVSKGEKVMEIYSPELVTAARELLYLVSSEGNESLVAAAKQKLILLGLSVDQVDALIKSKKVLKSFAVYSPLAGYITKHADRSSDAAAGSEMTSGLTIREGMYVKAGETLFTIVSHTDLWAEFDVYQNDISSVNIGDTAVVNVDNSYGTMRATIDRIQPNFIEKNGMVKIRMRLINPHHQYHAGQLVTAIFTTKTDSATWIPAIATVNLGSENIAFIKRDGTFRPVVIGIGRRSDEWLQVVEGLEIDDSIAYNGRFLVDSEDFINVKINKKQ